MPPRRRRSGPPPSITQELQLLGNGFDDRLDWVAGVYYFREQMANSPITRVGAAIQDNTINPDNESMSAFAQLTFEVVPGLRLTGGARCVHDVRKIVYTPARYTVSAAFAPTANAPASAVTPAACPFTAIGLNQNPGGCLYRTPNIAFDYVPFTVGLDYRLPDDGVLYAKYSKGFRSGGTSRPSRTRPSAWAPTCRSPWEASAR